MKKIPNSRFVNSLNKTFDEYCAVSSFHGMTFFKDKSTSKTLRIIWALTMLIMIYFANIMGTSLYFGFIESPVRMIIESDHAISAKILFPSVTVCPSTLFNHSRAVNLIKTFEFPKGVTEDNVMENLYQIQVFSESKLNQLSNDKLIVLNDVMKLNNYTLMKFYTKTYWNCGGIFFRCRFQSKVVNCSDIFRINKSYAGLCCSFNSKQSKDSVQLFKSNRHGIRQGLSLIFKDVEFDYEQLNSNAQRFQMLIHRPGAYPDESVFRKLLHRNEEILLRYDPIETTYSEEVWRRLTIDQRNCTLRSETYLHLFQEYNRQNCVSECLSSIILKICKCIPFNMFSKPNTMICDIEHISCLSNNYENIITLRDKCKCLDSCKKIEYSVRLTSGNIEPSLDVADPFYDGFHTNFTVVHVFLASQEYRRIRRDIVWNIVSLAGNLGNCYSVFVGISALSVFELLYFLTFVLRRNYKKNLNTGKKILFKSRKITTLNTRKL